MSRRGPGYWDDFPDTYRNEQIQTIARWIALGESGVVVGGSGAGKSNVVGFITTRLDVVGSICHMTLMTMSSSTWMSMHCRRSTHHSSTGPCCSDCRMRLER